MQAIARWIKADLRARRGQAALTVLAVAGIVAALITAATLLEDGTNPWRGLFTKGNGAHVWIHTVDPPDPAALRRLDGVADVAGPYRSAPATLVQPGKRTPITLREMPAALPRVGRPVVAEGRWLDPARPRGRGGGALLRQGDRAAAGQRVHRDRPRRRHATTSSWSASPRAATRASTRSGSPGSPGRCARRCSRSSRRAAAPSRSPGCACPTPSSPTSSCSARSPRSAARCSASPPGARCGPSMELDNRLLGMLLALFGAVGLVAAALAHRERGRRPGARPAPRHRHAQVARVHPRPGHPRAAGRARRARPRRRGARRRRRLGDHRVRDAGPRRGAALARPLAAIAGGTALTVLVAMGLPAWRGGRTPPIPAAPAAPPRGRCPGSPGSPCWYGCRPRSCSAPGTRSPGGCPRGSPRSGSPCR